MTPKIPDYKGIHDAYITDLSSTHFYNFYHKIPSTMEFVIATSKEEDFSAFLLKNGFILYRKEDREIQYTTSRSKFFKNDITEVVVHMQFRVYDSPLSSNMAEMLEDMVDDISDENLDEKTIVVNIDYEISPVNEQLLRDIQEFKFIRDKSNSIYIFEKSGQNLVLTPYKIDGFPLDVNKHYNADFKEVDRSIDTWLHDTKSPNNRLLLMSGKPGTGKTNYIKHLLTKCPHIKKIYLPPYLVSALSDPNFFSVIKDHKSSILIIEDAEKALISRDINVDNDAVSCLLNITDGILGTVLNFKVICTFNTDEKTLDGALTRKGRLFMKYHFDKLTADKTKNLFTELYNESPPEKEMTLADIFERDDTGVTAPVVKRIGFGA